MAIMNVVMVIWGVSLFAILAFGVACAASPAVREQLWGSERAPLTDANPHGE